MHADSAKRTTDQDRFFPVIDRYFIIGIALQVITMAFVPFLPLALAAVGLATPLRRSRWRMAVLWTLGAILSLIVIAPFIISWFHPQLINEGPTHTVTTG